MAKIKIGKRYRFDFAGMEYEGELFDIEKIQSTINVNHVWYTMDHFYYKKLKSSREQ